MSPSSAQCQQSRSAPAVPSSSRFKVQGCNGAHRPDSRPQPVTAALFGLHAAFTLKDATLEKAAALGHELGTGFHIHVAEAESDQDYSQQKHHHASGGAAEPVRHPGPPEHRRALRACESPGDGPPGRDANRRRAQSAVEPEQRGGHGGRRRHDQAERAGRPGHGRDDHQHAGGSLRVAVWAQHLRARDPSVGFGEVVSALLFNNPRIAEQMLRPPAGRTRARGAPATWWSSITIRPRRWRQAILSVTWSLALSQAAVDTTIVGGRVLMENKRLTLDLDEARINARARELAAKLWKRL